MKMEYKEDKMKWGNKINIFGEIEERKKGKNKLKKWIKEKVFLKKEEKALSSIKEGASVWAAKIRRKKDFLKREWRGLGFFNGPKLMTRREKSI